MNKYKAKRAEAYRKIFASKKERDRYLLLKEQEKHGEIEDLELQVKFELTPKNEFFRRSTYVADFTYSRDGKYIVEDVKGMREGTPYALFRLKQKVMYEKYKIVVHEI